MEIKDSVLGRILIVDDNLKNIQVLGKLLQNEKYEIEFATEGDAALKWIDNKQFDLMLLDINMPGMNGFEVCKEIRLQKKHDLPIIFLSAQNRRESILRGFELGAQDYIIKPFDKRELLARVKTQLEIKQNRDKIVDYLQIIQNKNNEITESITYAKTIQNAVQNTAFVGFPDFKEHFVLMLPKNIVGGDFYYSKRVGDKIIVGVFDSTGHGIPGAFLSFLGITFLDEIILRDSILEPNVILNILRSKIIKTLGQKGEEFEVKDGMDGLIITYDINARVLKYSGAFNPLYVIRDKNIVELRANRMPLSYSYNMEDFTVQQMKIVENDIVYLFSDGYIDQFGGGYNKKFKRVNFKKMLLKYCSYTMQEQKTLIRTELINWKGDKEQTDDITILGIKF